MGLSKYLFEEGEVLPAENVNSIDPDNPVAQAPAQLIGGTDVVLQNFIDLGLGDNDGKFKCSIDGVEHDDVSVDLFSSLSLVVSSSTGGSNNSIYDNIWQSQSFLMDTNTKINRIGLYLRKVSNPPGNLNVSIYEEDGAGKPTGSVLATSSIQASLLSTSYALTNFDIDLDVSSATKYCIVMSLPSGSSSNRVEADASSTGVYADGTLATSTSSGAEGTWSTSNADFKFEISVLNTDNIATAVQTAIRSKTSKLETVVWDTNKFVVSNTITGNLQGKAVLKFSAPTTGTDISGAGYLDLGANATEVAGQGDDYKLARYGSKGRQVDIESPTRSNNTVYQNTSGKTMMINAVGRFSSLNGAGHYGQLEIFIGDTDNPTISVGRVRNGRTPDNSIEEGAITVIVPDGYYYKYVLTTQSGSATLNQWVEIIGFAL